MTVIQINDMLSIGDQPDGQDIFALGEAGFRRLIDLRPDGEEMTQPGSSAERAAADQAGMSFSFIPVTMATIAESDIRAFQGALGDAGGPVFAHCKSGTRAMALYVLGEVLDGRMAAGDIGGFGKRHGFDLSGAVSWLQRNATRPVDVQGFHEPRTGSVQYVVSDPQTLRCAIIDPVLDFDERSGSTATRSAGAILDYIAVKGLTVEWILDTHPHADHFSAAQYLKQKTGAPTAIGEYVKDVQRLWKEIYNWPDLPVDGSQWDRLFAEGDEFKIGSVSGKVMFSPGHTLASVTYLIGDAAFVHDTMFMPDSGTARADFPGGDARRLWQSIAAILRLPEETRVFTGHDYQPGGRAARWESTVGERARTNPHLAGKAILRGASHCPGSQPANAEAHPGGAAGQHSRRTPAGTRGERPALPEDPA